MPRDKVTNEHQGYGFVEFRSEEDADYSIKIMHMIKLYGKPIKVNKASQDKKSQDIGANIFVGNLDGEVDEKRLFETFSCFGNVVSARINRDNTTGTSHRYGFVSFDNFESSDNAIQSMNGQFLCNRPITVTYAYKRDSKNEKYGSWAERILAANKPYNRPIWTGNYVAPANIPNFFPSMPSNINTSNIKPPPPPPSKPPKAPPV
jgi:splicing factor 3B subunit 4